MRGFLSLLAALAAAVSLANGPSQAYQEGPWCAVVAIGHGSVVERCLFWDFETCRQEVIAGNRGFCNQNPRWRGQLAASSAKSKPRKRVRSSH